MTDGTMNKPIILGEDCDKELLDNGMNLWIIRHAPVKSNGALYGGGLDLDTHQIENHHDDFDFLARRLGHLKRNRTKFYSSEQTRAIKTFDYLADWMDIIKDSRVSIPPLAEHHYGSLEGHDFEYLCGLAGGTWRELYQRIKDGNLDEIKNKLKTIDTTKQQATPGWNALQEQLKDGGVADGETLDKFYKNCVLSLKMIHLSMLHKRDREAPNANNAVIVSHRCRIRGLLAALLTLTKQHGCISQNLQTFSECLQTLEAVSIDNLSLTRVVITEGTLSNPSNIFITKINQKRSS